MRQEGHAGTALGLGLTLAAWRYPDVPGAILALVGALAGSSAPDWLEISHAEPNNRGGWSRWSLIPHRTITHWPYPWLAALLYGIPMLPPVWHPFAEGFVYAALLHLLTDFPNPTGIPLGLPWGRRTSLRWWRSGDYDNLLTTIAVAAGLSAILTRIVL